MATTRRKTIRTVERSIVLKAKDGDDPVAVFSSSGKLLGIVDPSKITPVSDPAESGQVTNTAKTANETKAMPKPTPSSTVVRRSGQQPAMGTQEEDPEDVAGVPVTDLAKAQAAARDLKRGLYGNALAADQDRLAAEMGAAAARVLKAIHEHPGQRR